MFFSVVNAYTQANNNKFDGNIKAIDSSNIKIAVIDGEMTSIIANADFPKAQKHSVSQLSGVVQTLLDVKSKKADITFVEPAVALAFKAKNPNSIKQVDNINPLRVFPNAMLIPKNEEDFKSTLNIAINELIYNGVIDKLIEKYEDYPNSFYKVQSAYRSK